MQINISSRHGHLSTESQDRIEDKVDKLSRFFDRITGIDVTVDLQHEDSPHVELRVSAEHTADFVATETAKNVSSALDSALAKVEQQLRKHKEKVTGHRATSVKHLDGTAAPPEAE